MIKPGDKIDELIHGIEDCLAGISTWVETFSELIRHIGIILNKGENS